MRQEHNGSDTDHIGAVQCRNTWCCRLFWVSYCARHVIKYVCLRSLSHFFAPAFWRGFRQFSPPPLRPLPKGVKKYRAGTFCTILPTRKNSRSGSVCVKIPQAGVSVWIKLRPLFPENTQKTNMTYLTSGKCAYLVVSNFRLPLVYLAFSP